MKYYVLLFGLIILLSCQFTTKKGTVELSEKKEDYNEKLSTQDKCKKFGLLIAVDSYEKENQIDELKKLKLNIKDDVELIAESFSKNNYHVEKMIGSNVVSKTDSNKPTRKRILKKIQKIGETCKNLELFVFYFTGHGKDEHLITYDYDSNYDYKDSSLLIYDLLDRIETYIKSKHIVVMIDACHSGYAHQVKDINLKQIKYNFDVSIFNNGKIQRKSTQNNDNNKQKQLRNNFHILTSSSKDEFSHTSNGVSYFAKSFVDAVNGKADGCLKGEKNYKIDLTEVDCYVKKNVQQNINKDSELFKSLIDPKTNKPYIQTPMLSSYGNQGEVIFTEKRDNDNEVWHFVKNSENTIDCFTWNDMIEYYNGKKFKYMISNEEEIVNLFLTNLSFRSFIQNEGMLVEFWLFEKSNIDTQKTIRFSTNYNGKDYYGFKCKRISNNICYKIFPYRPKEQCSKVVDYKMCLD